MGVCARDSEQEVVFSRFGGAEVPPPALFPARFTPQRCERERTGRMIKNKGFAATA